MDFLVDLVTGGIGGGILGLAGSLISGWMKQRAIESERRFEKEKWGYALQQKKLDMEASAQETEQELAIVSQEGSWQGLDRSTQHDTVLIEHSSSWVNNLKSLFRPILTTILQSGQLWMIYLFITADPMMMQIVNGSGDAASDIMKYVINSWVFAAQTSVVWWFGERAFAPPGMKNR